MDVPEESDNPTNPNTAESKTKPIVGNSADIKGIEEKEMKNKTGNYHPPGVDIELKETENADNKLTNEEMTENANTNTQSQDLKEIKKIEDEYLDGSDNESLGNDSKAVNRMNEDEVNK